MKKLTDDEHEAYYAQLLYEFSRAKYRSAYQFAREKGISTRIANKIQHMYIVKNKRKEKIHQPIDLRKYVLGGLEALFFAIDNELPHEDLKAIKRKLEGKIQAL